MSPQTHTQEGAHWVLEIEGEPSPSSWVQPLILSQGSSYKSSSSATTTSQSSLRPPQELPTILALWLLFCCESLQLAWLKRSRVPLVGKCAPYLQQNSTFLRRHTADALGTYLTIKNEEDKFQGVSSQQKDCKWLPHLIIHGVQHKTPRLDIDLAQRGKL